jgi:hypothetical protein
VNKEIKLPECLRKQDIAEYFETSDGKGPVGRMFSHPEEDMVMREGRGVVNVVFELRRRVRLLMMTGDGVRVD